MGLWDNGDMWMLCFIQTVRFELMDMDMGMGMGMHGMNGWLKVESMGWVTA